ncbi:MAG: hypothetical protein V4488_13790 [Pseudomonadota bacterium]
MPIVEILDIYIPNQECTANAAMPLGKRLLQAAARCRQAKQSQPEQRQAGWLWNFVAATAAAVDSANNRRGALSTSAGKFKGTGASLEFDAKWVKSNQAIGAAECAGQDQYKRIRCAGQDTAIPAAIAVVSAERAHFYCSKARDIIQRGVDHTAIGCVRECDSGYVRIYSKTEGSQPITGDCR